ncbi:MAG: endonuclease/exonuclease/phosphatase family protein [Noviherbaspirillum sp.]
MQQEIRFATFNVLNLALPGLRFYDNLEPYTPAEYEAKVEWIARQIDRLDADVLGLQEVFSQAAVKDVLARTKKYRDAQHLGFDPDPSGRFTPSVALVSRLPLAAAPAVYTELPRRLAIPLPEVDEAMTRFTRPVLHVPVTAPGGTAIHVFVVHLKSKRPDFRNGKSEESQYGVAQLRSLIRRSGEALGLRYLLTDFAAGKRVPLVVMGDFNDVAGAMATQLVLGTGRPVAAGFDDRMFDSQGIQAAPCAVRAPAFTHLRDGVGEVIDHILVSEDFHPASSHAIGEVMEVSYMNDHLELGETAGSDHGAVLARIRLFGGAPPGEQMPAAARE